MLSCLVTDDNPTRRILTGRDLEVLQAFDRTPLTAGQMLALSRTFVHPFGSERMVRERLQALGSVGWARSDRVRDHQPGSRPELLSAQAGPAIASSTANPPCRRRSDTSLRSRWRGSTIPLPGRLHRPHDRRGGTVPVWRSPTSTARIRCSCPSVPSAFILIAHSN